MVKSRFSNLALPAWKVSTAKKKHTRHVRAGGTAYGKKCSNSNKEFMEPLAETLAYYRNDCCFSSTTTFFSRFLQFSSKIVKITLFSEHPSISPVFEG